MGSILYDVGNSRLTHTPLSYLDFLDILLDDGERVSLRIRCYIKMRCLQVIKGEMCTRQTINMQNMCYQGTPTNDGVRDVAISGEFSAWVSQVKRRHWKSDPLRSEP